MPPNIEEDESNEISYQEIIDDRRLYLLKSRDRFGSNESTRKAFTNIARYNNQNHEDPPRSVYKPKHTKNRESGYRENVLPPSSSMTSSKQSHPLKSKSHYRPNAYPNQHPYQYPNQNHYENSNLHSHDWNSIENQMNGTHSVKTFPQKSNNNHRDDSYNYNSFQNHPNVEDVYAALERGKDYSETKALLQRQPSYNLDHSDHSSRLGKYGSDAQRQREIDLFSEQAIAQEPTTINDRYDIQLFKQTLAEIYTKHKGHSFIQTKLRDWFFNEAEPEFTSLQQINWAIIIGILMGIFTAIWAQLVDYYIEIVWTVIPETLLDWGVFTDLDGPRPLPHYIWICTGFFGGILSLVTVLLPKPIPGQNEWIKSLHRKGVIEYDTFFTIFLIATTGMASGLSLGPELPLVLTSGMAGSYFAKQTRQSVLSSRVMNLTAASAAIGGFFGFPMAGALFVLELPHQMGLQYFEALHPAILASITAVLANRIVTQNDIKGYFNYPFLTTTLPSQIFYVAIAYGLVGGLIGVIYAKGCYFLKTNVHDLFHYHEDHHNDHHDEEEHEKHQNVSDNANKKGTNQSPMIFHQLLSGHIRDEPLRAAVVGTLAGISVGIIGMFVPAVLFWGEEQLQSLIDGGTTPLPVFGRGDEMTADLTAYGYCMPKQQVSSKFSIGCSVMLTIAKVITYGVSLGTGVVGGQFWGPLFVGAAGANLFTSLMNEFYSYFGIGKVLTDYPCVALICMMGASHVVTFKASTAIMLILTLTISSFNTSGVGDTGGDYSAIFPLLVISCYVSLMMTRDIVFYKKQGSRGDLIVTEQTLCEPGKAGAPIMHFDDDSHSSVLSSYSSDASIEDSMESDYASLTKKTITTDLTNAEIERNFAMQNTRNAGSNNGYEDYERNFGSSVKKVENPSPSSSKNDFAGNVATLRKSPMMHRRIRSEDARSLISSSSNENLRSRSNSLTRRIRSNSQSDRSRTSSRRGSRRRIDSFGEIGDNEMHPPLLDQARMRAASKVNEDLDQSNVSRLPRKSHRRKSSVGKSSIMSNQSLNEPAGGMSQEDAERAFSTLCNQEYLG